MASPSTAFVQQYKDTISLLAQQSETRLRGAVMVDTNWTGEKKFYDQYATDTMVEILTRYQDTPIQAPDHRRRMITPRYFVSNTLEDPTDALQTLVDPKSAYMQAKVNSANRKIDSTIIDALGGTSYSGQNGSTSNTLAAAQKITAGSTGLTLGKITTAAKILNQNEAPKEDRTLVLNAEALDDCLNTTGITSVDYNAVKALMNGEINQFMGFNWVRSELLGVDSSSSRLLYAFAKIGVQLAIQKEAEGRIDERADKNYAWQVYMRIALGACRLDENMVVEIAIAE